MSDKDPTGPQRKKRYRDRMKIRRMAEAASRAGTRVAGDVPDAIASPSPLPPAPADPSIYDSVEDKDAGEQSGQGSGDSPATGTGTAPPPTAPTPPPDPVAVARGIVAARIDLLCRVVGPLAAPYVALWVLARRGKVISEQVKKRMEEVTLARFDAPDWPAALLALVQYLEMKAPEVYAWFLSNDTALAPLLWWGIVTAKEIVNVAEAEPKIA